MTGMKTNPLENFQCYRGDCPLIRSVIECNNRCRIENILYTATCTKCHDDQEKMLIPSEHIIESLYIGETSRTIGVRSKQHIDDYQKCQKQSNRLDILDRETSSFMWDHHIDKHENDTIDPNNDFKWKVLDIMKDPMTRQIREAVRIEDALNKGIILTHEGHRKIENLNRKEKHFQARK